MATASVSIVTHNRCALLPRVVQSASPAGRNVEAIVVDNASTAVTQSICAAMPGIRPFRGEEDSGPGEASNIVARASSSEYPRFRWLGGVALEV